MAILVCCIFGERIYKTSAAYTITQGAVLEVAPLWNDKQALFASAYTQPCMLHVLLTQRGNFPNKLLCLRLFFCCLNGILQLYNNTNCSQVRQEKGEFPVPWKSVNSTTMACITKMGWWLPKYDGYGKLQCIIWIMSCIRCTSFVSQSKLLYYVSFGYT